MSEFENSIYSKFTEGFFDKTILKTCNLINHLSLSVESKVYLFEDNLTKEKYTLKHVKDYKQFFTNETIDMIKNVSHPSIAEIIDIIIESDDLYIIKRYIDGVTLDELSVQRKVLIDSDIHYFMVKISKILKYLHSFNRLIHRDIKPANLVFTSSGDLVLIDLMSIRSIKEDQSSDTVYIGTSKYAAPEQFGYSQTDERTDIYNLGATMKMLQMDYSNNLQLDQIINKCLSFNPDDRYQNMDALLKNLEDITSHTVPSKKKPFLKHAILLVCLITISIYCVFLNLKNNDMKNKYSNLQETYNDLFIEDDDIYYRGIVIKSNDWVHIVATGDGHLYSETEKVFGLSRRINAYGSSLAGDMKWIEMTADVFIYSTYNPYKDLPKEIKDLIDESTYMTMKPGESIKLDYYSDSNKLVKVVIVYPLP